MPDVAGEVISSLGNGYVVHNMDKLQSVILTPGSDDASLVLTWTDRRTGITQTIHMKADSTGPSCIYAPPFPVLIPADTITITLTGTAPFLELTGMGEGMVIAGTGATDNLVSSVIVLLNASDNLVNQVEVQQL